ncbi:MAG: hypothetical protein HYV07_25395 [Deltaproteobacteria bacterium]|nr:hypothetical protein [Deltaproteobacteria bacterium]
MSESGEGLPKILGVGAIALVAIGPLVALWLVPQYRASERLTAWRTFRSTEAEYDCCRAFDERSREPCLESLRRLSWLVADKHHPPELLDRIRPMPESASVMDPSIDSLDRAYLSCPAALLMDASGELAKPPLRKTLLAEAVTKNPSRAALALAALSPFSRESDGEALAELAAELVANEAPGEYPSWPSPRSAALRALADSDLSGFEQNRLDGLYTHPSPDTEQRRSYVGRSEALLETVARHAKVDGLDPSEACGKRALALGLDLDRPCKAHDCDLAIAAYLAGAKDCRAEATLSRALAEPHARRPAIHALLRQWRRGETWPLETLRTATQPSYPVEVALALAEMGPSEGCDRLVTLLESPPHGPMSPVIALKLLGPRCAHLRTTLERIAAESTNAARYSARELLEALRPSTSK